MRLGPSSLQGLCVEPCTSPGFETPKHKVCRRLGCPLLFTWCLTWTQKLAVFWITRFVGRDSQRGSHPCLKLLPWAGFWEQPLQQWRHYALSPPEHQNVPGISPWVCGVWTQADLTRIHRLFQLRWSDPNQLAGKKGVEVTTLAVFEVKLVFDHVGPSGSFHLPLTGSTPDCVIGFARPSFWFLSAFRCVSSQRHCHDPQTKCCFTLFCFMSVMPWSCHTCFQIQSVTGPHRPNRALRVASLATAAVVRTRCVPL